MKAWAELIAELIKVGVGGDWIGKIYHHGGQLPAKSGHSTKKISTESVS